MFKKILSFLSDTKTILYIFLGVNLIGLIGFFLFGKLLGNQTLPYNQTLGIKILSFITYVVIVYFTYKGVKIVRLLMAAIVLLTGINGIFLGIFRIDWQQYLLKPYFTILGLYFIYGGIALFRYKKDEFLTSASRGTG